MEILCRRAFNLIEEKMTWIFLDDLDWHDCRLACGLVYERNWGVVIGDIIVGVIGALIGGLLFQREGIMPGAADSQSDCCDHRRDYLLIWPAHGQESLKVAVMTLVVKYYEESIRLP